MDRAGRAAARQRYAALALPSAGAALSEEKLQDTERVQQSEITRSLASETLQFEQSLREQLQASARCWR